MKFPYQIQLEPPQGLTPKELYQLGYMWAPEELIEVVTGPENFEELC